MNRERLGFWLFGAGIVCVLIGVAGFVLESSGDTFPLVGSIGGQLVLGVGGLIVMILGAELRTPPTWVPPLAQWILLSVVGSSIFTVLLHALPISSGSLQANLTSVLGGGQLLPGGVLTLMAGLAKLVTRSLGPPVKVSRFTLTLLAGFGLVFVAGAALWYGYIGGAKIHDDHSVATWTLWSYLAMLLLTGGCVVVSEA